MADGDVKVDGKDTGFRTLNGELVKSQEERMIANWLSTTASGTRTNVLTAIPSTTPTTSSTDDYLTDINVWHEHIALNSDGRPPSPFKPGYLDGVAWKGRTHRDYQTVLWETTSATVRDGTAFADRAGRLTGRGVVLARTGRFPGSNP